MVGYTYNPPVKVEEQQQVGEEKKSNEPVDYSSLELEDFSLSFLDSVLDFNDWIEENPDPSMADVKADDLIKFDSGNVEVLEKSIEIKEVGPFNETSSLDGAVGLETLGSLIEEEMGKVSLSGEIEGDNENCLKKNDEIVSAVGDGVVSGEVVNVDGIGMKNVDSVNNGVVSDDDSESCSSESSASSSSSSSDEEEIEEEERGETKNKEREMDMEEGEIRDVEGEEMVAWSDDEDDVGGGSVLTGPIKSKNEVQVLPPVPPVSVTIQPHHQTLPVGVVLSIIGAQVIVEGVEKHNPLSEGSILWITESKTPLGIVDEIFGPVKNPYYVVRYNLESEVPTEIHQGSLTSFVPEFADYVLNNNNLYKKGYDASGENDEELSDEVEFSDDEKEAEYKKMLKMSKRGKNEQNNGNMEKDKKLKNRRGSNWKNDHQPSPTSQAPSNLSQLVDPIQGFHGGPGLGPAFPPVAQPPNFTGPGPSSGVWTNGIPFVQPQGMGMGVGLGMGFPNGFPANIPWMQQTFPQQQPGQMPFPNAAPFHPQFDPSQMLPYGQPNFVAGPVFPSWPANMCQNGLNQPQVGPAFQGLLSPPSMNVLPQGLGPNGVQTEHNTGMRPPFIPGNGEASQKPNQGGGYPNRGGRKPFHGGGGRHFRGTRGGQQTS